MAEPTQGNPTPPNNQDGLVPPPAAGDVKKTEQLAKATDEASKAFDAFTSALDDAKKKFEEQKKTHEKQRQLNTSLNAAIIKELEDRSKTEKEVKKLNDTFKKYRDSQGNWLPKTEKLQDDYALQLKDITASLDESVKETGRFKQEIEENTKKLIEETNARDASIEAIEELADISSHTFPDLAKDYTSSLKEFTDTVAKTERELARASVEERQQGEGKVADKKGGLALALEEETRKEAVSKEAKEFDLQKTLNDIADAKKSEAETAEILNGLTKEQSVSLGKVREELDSMKPEMDAAVALYKERNQEANESDVKRFKEQFLMSKKKEMQENINKKIEKEINDLREKKIRSIMEEKKVSRSAAEKMAGGDADLKKSIQQMVFAQQQTNKGIGQFNSTQLLAASEEKSERLKQREQEAENKNFIPPWSQRIVDSISLLKDSFGGIFKGNEGMLKKIALILMIVIGAVVGYIWQKVLFISMIIKGIPTVIIGLLTRLPFGIGNAVARTLSGVFGNIGGAIGKLGAGAGGFFSKLFGPVSTYLGTFGKGLTAIFPFFGQLGKAFMFGFRVLGKVFFWVGLVVDAIMGAYKGFQQLGNVKGLIMGAVAQIVSGLTFGLLDFQSVFDFFGNTLGGLFDALASYFEQFYSLMIKPFVNAFQNIIGIFKGGGGMFSKILKSIVEMLLATAKGLVGYIVFTLVSVPVLIIKAVYHIVKFLGVDLPRMLVGAVVDAVTWFWNWITSGVWLNDVLSFGTWLLDKLVGFFKGILDSIADGLGELPVVGGYIKEALGGGSKKEEEGLAKAAQKTAEVVQEATEAQQTVASEASKVEFAEQPVAIIPTPDGTVQFAPMSAPSYPASAVNTASANTATAKMGAAGGGAGTAINAPTTNNVVQGGGGESNMLLPTNNRNTEPTFRALLFQECPAL